MGDSWGKVPIDNNFGMTTMLVMSENAEQAGNKFEGMRTTLIGVAGLLLSMTLEQWTKIGSLISIWATAFYMLFKCIDWITGKIIAKRARKRKNRPH